MVFLEKSFTFQEFLVELVGRALQLQNYKKLVIQVGINEELNRERDIFRQVIFTYQKSNCV